MASPPTREQAPCPVRGCNGVLVRCDPYLERYACGTCGYLDYVELRLPRDQIRQILEYAETRDKAVGPEGTA